MKFAKVMSGAAVAVAAFAALGGTAAAVPSTDMGVLTWRVVAGPYPGNDDGLTECQRDGIDYKAGTGAPVGCLLDADSNQYFLWANQ
ncbi:hypothetical protein [Lentzea kentuckyensis]|uniref:hypothetical protein n=1 Tax=Lentzea kentuckyensis TaxID=360086 RepID=UPI00117AAF66|nr:hypothetical protein [Lentzea kentuckyensis]